MILEDRRSDNEVRIRFAQAKQYFIIFKTVLTNKRLQFKNKKKVLEYYVYLH